MGMIFWYYKIGIFVYFLWLWFIFANDVDSREVVKKGGPVIFIITSLLFLTVWVPILIWMIIALITKLRKGE